MNHQGIRSGKEMYFQDGNQNALLGVSDKAKNIWLSEKALTDCNNCATSDECPHKFKDTRFPVDAGGQCQCIRLAKQTSPYAFVNVNGEVIIIPDTIIDTIIGSIVSTNKQP